MTSWAAIVLCGAVAAADIASAQELGRKGRLGIELYQHENYERARTTLEDALVETPNHPVIYEYIGLAYLACGGTLDSKDCLSQAEAAMNKAIEQGGRATFVVDRSLERGGLFANPNPLKVQRGLLHITRSDVSFQPDKPTTEDGPISVVKADLKEAKLNAHNGKNTNWFHISGKGKGAINLRTAAFSADEAEIVFRLLQTHLGLAKTKE